MDKSNIPSPEIPPEYRADIDFDRYDFQEMGPPEWITELDREILAILGNSMIIMTPAVIAKNIDRPRSSVSHRLTTLEAGSLVTKLERGHYQISSEGYARMAQKLHYEDGGDDLPSSTGDWEAIKIPTSEELKEIEE